MGRCVCACALVLGYSYDISVEPLEFQPVIAVYMYNYPINAPRVLLLSPNVPLIAGDRYQRVASSKSALGGNDEVFDYLTKLGGTAPNYPISVSDITVTGEAFSSGKSEDTGAWSGFTNIPTGQEVPEPASLSLFGLGIVSAAGYVYRRRKATQV
jgi:hypothetical protein